LNFDPAFLLKNHFLQNSLYNTLHPNTLFSPLLPFNTFRKLQNLSQLSIFFLPTHIQINVGAEYILALVTFSFIQSITPFLDLYTFKTNKN